MYSNTYKCLFIYDSKSSTLSILSPIILLLLALNNALTKSI